jgi:hypothetical protein
LAALPAVAISFKALDERTLNATALANRRPDSKLAICGRVAGSAAGLGASRGVGAVARGNCRPSRKFPVMSVIFSENQSPFFRIML